LTKTAHYWGCLPVWTCSFEKAAKELRLPYFDWGNMDTLKFGMPDELCSLSEVTVETPFQTAVRFHSRARPQISCAASLMEMMVES